MRRTSLLPAALGSLLGLLLVTSTHAGTLTHATWFQVTEGFPFTQGVPLTRTGAQLGITGTSTSTSLVANLSYPFTAITLFVPKTANNTVDLAVQATQGGPQQITATPGMGGGSPGIPGSVRVMSAVHDAMGVNQSQFMVGTNTIVLVPISVGKAGLFVNTFLVSGILHKVRVDFYAWTPDTLVFTGLTSKYQPIPDVTAAGSFGLTANGGGTVTLVSPSRISIDGLLAQRRTVAVTTLVLSFVPEPGTLLLLGGAAGALSLAGRRARR